MFGLTTTRRLGAELAAVKAETDRQRRRAETAEGHAATAVFNRKQVLRQLADADADNRRLAGRNLELGKRISTLTEADPEYAAGLERRVTRLRTVGKRILAAYKAERQRADRLVSYLDDGDLRAIKTWEQRIEAHNGWKPGADPTTRPIDGAPGRPTHPAVELRRALERCRALEARLTVAEGRKRVAS
jgi:hypothetical protein